MTGFTFEQEMKKHELTPIKGINMNIPISQALKNKIMKYASALGEKYKTDISQAAFVRTCIRIGIKKIKNELENKEKENDR